MMEKLRLMRALAASSYINVHYVVFSFAANLLKRLCVVIAHCWYCTPTSDSVKSSSL